MNTTNKKTYIVIPAYNESKVIKKTIGDIKKHGYSNIIVVDDGSRDNTLEVVRACPGVIGLRHAINRGAGAATVTAIEAAKEMGADIIVVFDADGQHDPKDIESMVKPISEGKCDVVLSKRLFNKDEMPLIKVFYNYIGNLITFIFLGLWVSDSQSGFRAYSKHAANTIETRADEYEYSSMVIREIKQNDLKYQEVPIKVFYTDHSMGKAKKQSFVQGVKTAWKILWHTIS